MGCICNYIWEKNGRGENEDALAFTHVTKEGRRYILAIVCDGIGGLQEGENASSFTVECMNREMMKLLEKPRILSRKRWRNAFLRRIDQCHKQLSAYGKERGIRLGTTLSLVFLQDQKGHILHVGDSAVFAGRYRLKRKTPIHRTKSGALQWAVGAGENLHVEWKQIRIRKGSVVLLCSDGFYEKIEKKLVSKKGMIGLPKKNVSEEEVRIWLNKQADIIKQLGERDNISALCLVF